MNGERRDLFETEAHVVSLRISRYEIYRPDKETRSSFTSVSLPTTGTMHCNQARTYYVINYYGKFVPLTPFCNIQCERDRCCTYMLLQKTL